MQRVILHSDMNNFYASVETVFDPSLRGRPIAVGGDPGRRHGIVLAKNGLAKRCGVKTGETLWQARQKCPDILFVPPHFDRYLDFSRRAKAIYASYTDQVEAFGLDECWLDVTDSRVFGTGEEIAQKIRARIREELKITASIGVSYNKVFAKLGSDMKKPDAVTAITPENYRAKVWPLPAADLLFVGRATSAGLQKYGIRTIGDIARTDAALLQSWFGKNGLTLWQFANGYEASPVRRLGEEAPIKSVGNSTTTPRDLVCEEDVKITLYTLAESVAARLREDGLLCSTVTLAVRDQSLKWFERQLRLPEPSCVSSAIALAALSLFRENVRPPYALRSLGVRASELSARGARQLSMLPEAIEAQKQERIETAIDSIRARFGHAAVQRGLMFGDRSLSELNPASDHAGFGRDPQAARPGTKAAV